MVKLTYYVVDATQVSEVRRLFRADVLIEIEAVAVVPSTAAGTPRAS